MRERKKNTVSGSAVIEALGSIPTLSNFVNYLAEGGTDGRWMMFQETGSWRDSRAVWEVHVFIPHRAGDFAV